MITPSRLSSKVYASSLTPFILNMFDCSAGKDHNAWTHVQEGGCFTDCCCCTHGKALLHQLSSRWINVVTACPLATSSIVWQSSPGLGNTGLCFGVPVCQAINHVSSSPVVGWGWNSPLGIPSWLHSDQPCCGCLASQAALRMHKRLQ